METFERTRNGLLNSVGIKLGLIAFLTLLLLIPAAMIMSLIREREQRRDETIQQVTEIWGNVQTLCGPVLTIPVKTNERSSQNDSRTMIRYLHILPDKLNIHGVVQPEVRYRGIYKVVTYKAKLHVEGYFSENDLREAGIKSGDIEGKKIWIELGIPDLRGINQNINLRWNDTLLSVFPGVPSQQLFVAGVHIPIELTLPLSGKCIFDIDLNGSRSLNFVPLGKETLIELSSTWDFPSFSGAFLPDERQIKDTGFTARWNILQLNRNYPQQWIGDQYSINESIFGVDLITPVDAYQKSMRSVKYAVLFIGLTFLVFFFSEVLTKVRIHPVNYLLVGISLCVFYSLLTALAEHIDFTLAYAAGSMIIISMISCFAHSLYKKWQVTITITASLIALYAFLFVLLQLTDFSLLLGNIILVIIIGIVMYFSRKVDWYSPVRTSDEIADKNKHQ